MLDSVVSSHLGVLWFKHSSPSSVQYLYLLSISPVLFLFEIGFCCVILAGLVLSL